MVWPYGGSPSDLVASFKDRLNQYPDASKKMIVIEKYQDISDHQRTRREDYVVIDYSIATLRTEICAGNLQSRIVDYIGDAV